MKQLLSLDANQNKQIKILFGLVGALGALMAVKYYRNEKKNYKLKTEILTMDKKVKQLQLKKLASEGFE
tara:strand:- start:169 stop:375 length:207 start_codon:yes stop_codon:yes gene_type:complete